MSQKPNAYRIGLFILAAVAIVILALFVFGIRKSFESKHRLVTYIPGDVEGLAIGSPVKLKGVAVGQVTDLSFSWNRYPGTKRACVIVDFEVKDSASPVPNFREKDFEPMIRENVEIGLRAIVKGQGITGSSILELEILDPAKNPPFPYDWPAPRHPYVPAAPTELGRIMGSLNRTLAKLEKFDTERIGAQIETTLAAAETALKKVAEIDTAGISGGANQALASANGAILEVQGLAKDARGKVNELPAQQIGEDARRVLAGLDETNLRIQSAVDRLSGVDVEELNSTLAELRLAARGLADAISTIRKQPSQILLGSAPAPATSLERGEKK